jgi:hypothetical protein
MKANVSLTDSITGVALASLVLELSPANASRGWTNNKLKAMVLIAIARRNLFSLVIFNLH